MHLNHIIVVLGFLKYSVVITNKGNWNYQQIEVVNVISA